MSTLTTYKLTEERTSCMQEYATSVSIEFFSGQYLYGFPLSSKTAKMCGNCSSVKPLSIACEFNNLFLFLTQKSCHKFTHRKFCNISHVCNFCVFFFVTITVTYIFIFFCRFEDRQYSIIGPLPHKELLI